MSIHAHIQSLSQKHAALEESIAEEMKRPLPDEGRIAALKRQKLRLKEELSRLPSGTA